MDVPPHPHTGLQTASWLFTGEIEHRDSGGVHQLVRPGEAEPDDRGCRICHSEVSTPATTVLQRRPTVGGAAGRRPRRSAGLRTSCARSIFARRAHAAGVPGRAGRTRSPVHTFTPLLGAQLDLAAGSRVDLDVDPTFEHGVLLDLGASRSQAGAWRTASSPTSVRVRRRCGCTTRRGFGPGAAARRPPFGEDLLMWWNFVARTHDEIVDYRRLWQDGDPRFGAVSGTRDLSRDCPHPRCRPRGCGRGATDVRSPMDH